jgi:hypothetical protein
MIVSGRVSQIADRYRFTVRALEVQTSRVQGQNNWNMAAGKTITALMKDGGSGGAVVAGGTASGGRASAGGQASGPSVAGNQVAGRQAATPARPAAPKNGTYTFWPRPRGKQNGMPVDTYLIKVVVDGQFMLFYFTTTERGVSRNNPRGIDNGFLREGTLLTNLDRPSQSWPPVSYRYNDNNNGEGSLLSFEGVTAARFSLNLTDKIVIDEIILGEPDE